MGKITQQTLIPVGLAVVVIGASAGWVTRTTMEISAIAAAQASQQQKKESFENRVDERLGNLERAQASTNTKLDMILKLQRRSQ